MLPSPIEATKQRHFAWLWCEHVDKLCDDADPYGFPYFCASADAQADDRADTRVFPESRHICPRSPHIWILDSIRPLTSQTPCLHRRTLVAF